MLTASDLIRSLINGLFWQDACNAVSLKPGIKHLYIAVSLFALINKLSVLKRFLSEHLPLQQANLSSFLFVVCLFVLFCLPFNGPSKFCLKVYIEWNMNGDVTLLRPPQRLGGGREGGGKLSSAPSLSARPTTAAVRLPVRKEEVQTRSKTVRSHETGVGTWITNYTIYFVFLLAALFFSFLPVWLLGFSKQIWHHVSGSRGCEQADWKYIQGE